MNIEPIAFIMNDYKEKFGVPRQSGLVNISSKIILEPNFRDRNALRGLEDFTHIWLIWGFSENETCFSPTVRPPRLGGNARKGVFATRSPFRPNSLGLSVVKLAGIDGFTITVTGADLMSGTPIYDIKPYLPYADSIPDASNGWALAERKGMLKVEIPEKLLEMIPEDKRPSLTETLSQDPRPQYQDAPERVYTMAFGDFQISFTVDSEQLTVVNVTKETLI